MICLWLEAYSVWSGNVLGIVESFQNSPTEPHTIPRSQRPAHATSCPLAPRELFYYASDKDFLGLELSGSIAVPTAVVFVALPACYITCFSIVFCFKLRSEIFPEHADSVFIFDPLSTKRLRTYFKSCNNAVSLCYRATICLLSNGTGIYWNI